MSRLLGINWNVSLFALSLLPVGFLLGILFGSGDGGNKPIFMTSTSFKSFMIPEYIL
jgi:hypothetical protein